MTTTEAKRLLETDPDFVHLKRFNFSLAEVLKRYPEGAPERIIAQALLMTEDDVEQEYQRIIRKLRRAMGVTL